MKVDYDSEGVRGGFNLTHVLQQLQQRLLDETDARVIAMMIEPNRFKTFCIRIDSLAKHHQQKHHDAMHS